MTGRMQGCPTPEIEQHLDPTRDAPRAARHAVRTVTGQALAPWRRPDADLLVTELVSNSLLHAATGPITVRASVADGRLRVEVWDAGPGLEGVSVRMPTPDARRGRGLPLVQRLADAWGTGRAGGRCCVWFSMEPEAAAG